MKKLTNIQKIMVLLVACGFLFTTLVYHSASAGSVLDFIKVKEKVVRKILMTKTTVDTEAHKLKTDKLRSTINDLFDFKELGMRALELHWDTLNEAQQNEFVATLQALIEKNYLMKTAKTTSYKIKWGKIAEEEGYSVVPFKVKSGKFKATIHFRMLEKAGKWVVFDMLIDEVSLMENYRSQFNRIIRKKGFDKLLEKMNRRLNEMDKKSDGDFDSDESPEPTKIEPVKTQSVKTESVK